MPENAAAELVELRVLDGPNLYFTRPAIKLTLDVSEWMSAPEDRISAMATRVSLPGAEEAIPPEARLRPGKPGTVQRARLVARLAAHLTRLLARATKTRLAVRARPGPEPDQIVVSFPWRTKGTAEAFGREIAVLLDGALDARRSPSRLLESAAERIRGTEPGPEANVPEPEIPVIAVTGTNGKTTTVRLLAHLARTAGLTVAYSSTDGVYLNDRLVEGGDYSGYGGAATALAQQGVEIAVLETARGGILFRGIGTAHNDVAVVTNVSADHLGLMGINTLDQLAEVKATILRITKPDGWDVLNADDPRVLAMRRASSGRVWLFTMDSDHPAVRDVLEEGGRAVTVIDGVLTVLLPGHQTRFLLPLEDIPVTLAGISTNNVLNAMAGAAAALGAGIHEEAVVEGLRTFVLDPETNPGRANLFELDGRIIVVDYAHNEAGMAGLVEVCHGLRPDGGEIWLAFCNAGDRSNEIIHGYGYLAARGSDHLAIAGLPYYLRGRDPADLLERQRAAARDGGVEDVPAFPGEMQALTWMLERARSGDVVAITALGQRKELFSWLEEKGATRVGPERIKELVHRAAEE